MPTRLLRALVFCAVLSLTLANAYGGTKNWNITTGSPGNWSMPGNWTPYGLPGPSDDVTIYHPSGDFVNLDAGTATIDSLTLGGYVAGLPASVLYGTGGQNLTINNQLFIAQTGILELQAGDVVTVNFYTGSFTNFGSFYIGPGAQVNTLATPGIVYAGSTDTIMGTLTTSYFVNLNTLAGQVFLQNGQTWYSVGGGEDGTDTLTITNSGRLTLGNGTSVFVGVGGIINNNELITGDGGGNNHLYIFGTLINNAVFQVSGNNDTAEITYFTNSGEVDVGTGATLTLDNTPGITDIPANSGFGILGTFNQSYNTSNPSPFYDLTSIEGALHLGNGQTTDITPNGGTLLNSGILIIDNGSTLNVHGTLTNNGTSSWFLVRGLGTVANLDMLNNNGLTEVFHGATLNLTNQPNGIMTVVAGSTFDIAGDFNTVTLNGTFNGFYQLNNVMGTVVLENGKIWDVYPGVIRTRRAH